MRFEKVPFSNFVIPFSVPIHKFEFLSRYNDRTELLGSPSAVV